MAVKVREYLDYFRECRYPALFSEEDIEKLKNVEKIYGDMETEETILETCLSDEKTGCDYSIRKDVNLPEVKEYWYELDGDACGKEDIPACYFVDASKVRLQTSGCRHAAASEQSPAGVAKIAEGMMQTDNHVFYEEVLVPLVGRERMDRLRGMLDFCIEKLEGKCDGLFQLGSMTGRMELDRIRLFTDDMTGDNLVRYLEELNWKGDTKSLYDFLKKWESYSDRKSFILDFDVLEQGISERIGINFGTGSKKRAAAEALLDALGNAGLCTEKKKEDVLRFIGRFPSHMPFIQNDISHFKIPFMGKEPLRAKVYLRQGSVCYCPDFKAYDTPALMNLELTTRCPLRCPQCYCDLSGGKDMELDTALYWLKEAAANHVRTVNLSGGETMVYPHLERLLEACRALGMEANVALSGYGADREKLEAMIAGGVADICISLNGSTEEINCLSRDGYGLAIRALQTLCELGYEKTYINWVMRSDNADDFVNMLSLAERYQAAGIVVMVFKPDAQWQRPNVPAAEQIFQIAKSIKEYRGPVQIEVEECFSQLRAVLGKRFFTNLNRGIARGCGAGRDGISVSVDGKLTPCRHLEIQEEFHTIREYWEKSETVQLLRQAEETMEKPCIDCSYRKYCLPCMAGNWKTKGRIYMGEEECTIWK